MFTDGKNPDGSPSVRPPSVAIEALIWQDDRFRFAEFSYVPSTAIPPHLGAGGLECAQCHTSKAAPFLGSRRNGVGSIGIAGYGDLEAFRRLLKSSELLANLRYACREQCAGDAACESSQLVAAIRGDAEHLPPINQYVDAHDEDGKRVGRAKVKSLNNLAGLPAPESAAACAGLLPGHVKALASLTSEARDELAKLAENGASTDDIKSRLSANKPTDGTPSLPSKAETSKDSGAELVDDAT